MKKTHRLLKNKFQFYSRSYNLVIGAFKTYKMHGVFGIKVLIAEKIIEKSIVKVKVSTGIIKFLCPGVLSIRNAKIYFECEPDTYEWIHNFNQDSVFYDIGGNLGGLSLLAGSLGHRVFCFEPAAINVNCIQQNIYLNPSISENISVIPVALSNQNKISHFFMQNVEAGAVKNSVDRPEWWMGGFDAKFKQSVLSMTLDDCIQKFSLPSPNYVKIDVDGNEEIVLDGMKKTLKSSELLEVFVELPLSSVYTSRVIKELEKYNLKVVGKVDTRDITNYHFAKDS